MLRFRRIGLIALVGLAACSSGGRAQPTAPPTPVPSTASPTTATGTIQPHPSSTVAKPTTTHTKPRPTTTLASTTSVHSSTTKPATSTTAAGPACTLALIVGQTGTNYPGVTPGGLRCAGDWASWSGTPDDPVTTDGYFAVARRTGGRWVLGSLGTAGVCTGAGVPTDLWPLLDCTE